MRSIKELLILVREEFPKIKSSDVKDMGSVVGLCEVGLRLSKNSMFELFTFEEINLYLEYLDIHLPKVPEDIQYAGYTWPVDDLQSRVDWLSTHIKLLEDA